MAITLENYLPKTEEDYWEIYNNDVAKRAKDYLEEVYPLENLMLAIEGTDNDVIVHAACLYSFLETKHVTSGGNPSIADEIAMEGVTEYIDHKVKGIVNYHIAAE